MQIRGKSACLLILDHIKRKSESARHLVVASGPMHDLTDYERRMLQVLARFRDECGNSFSATDEELARASPFLLTSGVNRLLKSLESRCKIRRSGRRPRAIEVFD